VLHLNCSAAAVVRPPRVPSYRLHLSPLLTDANIGCIIIEPHARVRRVASGDNAGPTASRSIGARRALRRLRGGRRSLQIRHGHNVVLAWTDNTHNTGTKQTPGRQAKSTQCRTSTQPLLTQVALALQAALYPHSRVDCVCVLRVCLCVSDPCSTSVCPSCPIRPILLLHVVDGVGASAASPATIGNPDVPLPHTHHSSHRATTTPTH
jgi:hypothetical protein